MAKEQNAGSVVYTVSAEIEPLLIAGKQAIDVLDKLDAAAQQSGKGMDSLDQSTSQTGSAFNELAGYANSMDNQLRKLNTNVSGIARAMEEARSGTGGANSEFNRAESIIEALGNQLAILDEAQENGARSAAVLAAQLRAGSKATDEEKQKIGELTGRLYDMKTSVDAGSKGHGNWKNSMQQAGYQVQDFIVQVQGGQSALVAFAQQGSQLAGAFGPGGAVVGAVLALSTVVAGALITSLNGGKSAMDALKDAAEAMDKVITISQNGVAALSDKYAMLAKTNAEAATILRNQAIIEYNSAVSKIPKAIGDAAASVIDFGDKALSAFSGGYASIKGFSDRLASLNITTDDYTEAMKQAYGAGQAFQATASSIGNTVGSVASKFAISEQAAFKLVKQMDEVQRTKSTEALQRLVIELQNTKSSSDSGTNAIIEFLKPLTELVGAAGMAKVNLAGMNLEMDNLTAGQKNLIKQTERNLALSKLQGEERVRLQAQYAAEDAGFAKDDPHAKQMEQDAAATYRNTQAQKTFQSERKKGVSQAESIAQKLANLKQQAELAAGSTQQLSREQAILTAQQSLGAAATQKDLELAGQYAARIWDTTNALKMRQQAEQASRFIGQEVAASKVQRDPYTGEAQDPAAQVNEEEQRKLEALAKYQQMGVINAQQFEDGKTAIARQASNDRISIAQQEAKRQVDVMNMLLGGIGEGFSGLAEIVSKSAGESNAAYKTLFAISKAFAVAQSTLNLQLALSNAMASGPFPWNMAAMAQVAAAGGQVISSIGAMSYGGGREHGGPVSASSMYRVGEGGKPEIFKASNGSQYMIPGDNGRVISNRDIGGGGGAFNYSPVIQVNGDPTEQTLAMLEAAVKRGAKQGYAMAVSDVASGKGKLSNALTNNFNTSQRLT
ncbi:TPA: tail protein (tape measure) [Enterobacter roggenkampii]|nr:tail protein (tape measure) [Enterobacter roggenkampii]